ncbi:uncharacterized protein LOC126388602 [Epinephelus moara]|uniref:uncharacterized protein LOC126388602 n=1 Tax=Epinephelus moara TaxID=300413 RepID=UPI00214F1E64|nr:uncharacterized protein LOC126388602 [Epinephelus moara]
MFYIVEFYETQEVEVVPAAWVADDVCQWPTYYKPDELAKAIKNEEQPGDSWEEYRVRILYKAASYKAARLKLPEAETHTDLQTAEEDDDMPRRKRKRNVIGGVDIKDTVWRIMKHLFTNSLAKQLNWRGVNGKTAFHSLQLKDVITGTVRNNHLTATATDQEVEAYIKRWLHLAGDRDGGRREREEKRRASQHTRPQEDEQ